MDLTHLTTLTPSILCDVSYVIKAFAENSHSTSAATRCKLCKLVELLFSAKAFPTKKILGLKWSNE